MNKNKEIVRKFYEELWNNRNLELANEIIAPECITHQLHSGEEMTARLRPPEVLKAEIAQWLAGFPDLFFSVEQSIGEGDRVMTQSVLCGTHTGRWLGIAPTGKFISVRLMVVQRIGDGKIVEDWVLVESLGLWQQLGLLPPTQEILDRSAEP